MSVLLCAAELTALLQTEKKVLSEEEEKDNAVRMRTNLSIPLLPEKEEDKKLAALLTYQAPDCKYQTHTHTLIKYISLGIVTLFISFIILKKNGAAEAKSSCGVLSGPGHGLCL